MKRTLFAAAAVAALGTVALAQAVVNPAITERKAILKTFGAAAGDMGKMVRGEQPFDAAKVKANLMVYIDGTKKLPGLFPDDSKTGGNTEALPAIWEKKAEFVAIYAKLGADAEAADKAITNVDTLKTEWPKLTANCGTCHKTFRVPPKPQ